MYLPEQLINAEPGLSRFSPGIVLGSRHLRGLDLTRVTLGLATDPVPVLNPDDCREMAITATVTDTLLWNADRSPGTLGRRQIGTNPGNLFFAAPPTPGGEWQLTLIDYDHAFCGAQWGGHSNGEWPVAVLGTMRYFFERRYLPMNSRLFMTEALPLVQRVEGLDIGGALHAIMAEAPTTWVDGTHGHSLQSTHLDDLRLRLERQQVSLRATLETHFDAAVKIWGGV